MTQRTNLTLGCIFQGRELETADKAATRELLQLPGNVGGLFSGGAALDPAVLLAQTILFAVTSIINQLGLLATLLSAAGQASQTSITVSTCISGGYCGVAWLETWFR
jgi:hypothetical protein